MIPLTGSPLIKVLLHKLEGKVANAYAAIDETKAHEAVESTVDALYRTVVQLKEALAEHLGETL